MDSHIENTSINTVKRPVYLYMYLTLESEKNLSSVSVDTVFLARVKMVRVD
jgi:hypothetical protein